jgi:hypothetical protein
MPYFDVSEEHNEDHGMQAVSVDIRVDWGCTVLPAKKKTQTVDGAVVVMFDDRWDKRQYYCRPRHLHHSIATAPRSSGINVGITTKQDLALSRRLASPHQFVMDIIIICPEAVIWGDLGRFEFEWRSYFIFM